MKRLSFAIIAALFVFPLSNARATSIGTWSVVTFTDPVSSGISTSNVYTQAVDLQSTTNLVSVDINGVFFEGGGQSESNYSTTGTYGGAGPYPNSTGLQKFFNEYLSGGYYPEAVTLPGLKIGTTYDARFYSSNQYLYGSAPQIVTAANGATIDTDPSDFDSFFGYDSSGLMEYLQYQYTAQATSLTVTFTPESPVSDFYQLYGFSNQVAPAPVPEPASAGIVALGALSLLFRRRRE
jgi:hypothetical protein